MGTDKLAPQPSLLEAVGAEPAQDEPQLVAYLKGGHVLIDVMDTNDDLSNLDDVVQVALRGLR